MTWSTLVHAYVGCHVIGGETEKLLLYGTNRKIIGHSYSARPKFNDALHSTVYNLRFSKSLYY